jgi:hypothetical protein
LICRFGDDTYFDKLAFDITVLISFIAERATPLMAGCAQQQVYSIFRFVTAMRDTRASEFYDISARSFLSRTRISIFVAAA